MEPMFDHNAPAAPEPPVTDAPAAAPAPAPAPPKPKVRRVGTFAFGLVLITAGALLLANLMVPGFDLLTVARFAPVILIVLGIEVLVYASRPNVVLKYDFLSMIACFFILLVVGAASILPQIWSVYGPEADLRQQRLNDELEQAAYEAVSADPALKGVVYDAGFTIYRDVFYDPTVKTLADLPAHSRESYADFTLNRAYETEGEFAADCRRICAACADLPIGSYHFYGTGTTERDVERQFNMNISGPWQSDPDGVLADGHVNVSYHWGDASFDNKEDLDAYRAEVEGPQTEIYEEPETDQ